MIRIDIERQLGAFHSKVSFATDARVSALFGRSGSGKTSLINMLIRFYEPTNGDILVDGIDVRDYPLDFLRSQFALVLRGIISLKLIKTKDGNLTGAVEILRNSPQIAKMIEEGQTKDILEAMESSVGLYRMQSMNQSLMALLVHQKISYQDAMALSSDPDDLSLKLRKLFPQIEDRVREGGDMAPSYSDFSQITELMDIKRLYEEQEVQWRQRLADKDEQIENMKHDLEWRSQQAAQQQGSFAAKDEEIARLRGDMDRLRGDAQAKITQLQERIKELNQKLMGAGGGAAPGVKR